MPFLLSALFLSVSVGAQEAAAPLDSWETACLEGGERGLSRSCANAAIAADENGDVEKAKRYYAMACREGRDGYDPGSCHSHAVFLYEAGDREGAWINFERACHGGIGVSCANIANAALAQGDEPRAEFFLNMGCAWGETLSCYNMGIMLQARGLFGQAASYHEGSCREGAGIGKACGARGMIALRSNLRDEATRWFGFGCEGRGETDTKSCTNLGILMYEDGYLEEALALFVKACADGRGEPTSCFYKGVTENALGRRVL